jgi:hypothetical protein
MKDFHKTCEIAIFIGVVNFLLFILISVLIGGDAVNGKVANGHYYLASHGKLTEVSAFVFGYSQLHIASLFVTFPLVAIASVAYRLTGGERTLSTVEISGVRFPLHVIALMVTMLIVGLLAGVAIFFSGR